MNYELSHILINNHKTSTQKNHKLKFMIGKYARKFSKNANL